jgi:cytochrome P450
VGLADPAGAVPTIDTGDRSVWEEPAGVLGPLMRAGHRVVRTTQPSGPMLLGADLVHQALVDARLGAPGAELLQRTGWQDGPYMEWFRRVTVHVDPPDHTRLRALVSRAFTPRAVGRFRSTAERVAHDCCDRMVDDLRFDFTERFARLLPLRVICELLGVEVDVDTERVGRWSSTLGRSMSASAAAVQPTADAAAADFGDYVRTLIDARRSRPGDDLLSALIEAEEDGERLDEHELVILTMQLIFAGHETTQTLISTGLWRLLSQPDQLDVLRTDPSIIPNAVEEMLRLDPPAVVVARVPRETFDLDGVRLESGDYVTLSLFSANHDPSRFDHPDRLDVRREVDRQFAFGFGPHFCVGNHLARVEAAVAFEVLLSRFDTITEVGESRWIADTLRGRGELVVHAEPPAAAV